MAEMQDLMVSWSNLLSLSDRIREKAACDLRSENKILINMIRIDIKTLNGYRIESDMTA